MTRQILIFDADDTLWENNVYFERAIHEFVSFLDHAHLSHDEVRAVLDEFEIKDVPIHGYGARSFATSLRHTFQHLTDCADDDPRLSHVESLGLGILQLEMQILPGVTETLAALQGHHDLFLLTKGHEEEQRLKIERSGLEDYFVATIIVPEKRPATFREIVDTFAMEPATTWMIGNSPRSDINPALAAGLNAVHVPHPSTWRLEVEPFLEAGTYTGQLLHVDHIEELGGLFTAVDAATG